MVWRNYNEYHDFFICNDDYFVNIALLTVGYIDSAANINILSFSQLRSKY